MPGTSAAASLGDCIEEAIDRIVSECFNEPTEERRRTCVRAAIGDLFGCIAQIQRSDAGCVSGEGERPGRSGPGLSGRAGLRLARPDKDTT